MFLVFEFVNMVMSICFFMLKGLGFMVYFRLVNGILNFVVGKVVVMKCFSGRVVIWVEVVLMISGLVW